MLAFIENFQLSEAIIIVIVAVLIFGRRLPQVAGQAAAHLGRARRALNELWRDSGLEEEMRKVQREVDHSRSAFAMPPRRAAGGEPRRLGPPPAEARPAREPLADHELVVRPPAPQPSRDPGPDQATSEPHPPAEPERDDAPGAR